MCWIRNLLRNHHIMEETIFFHWSIMRTTHNVAGQSIGPVTEHIVRYGSLWQISCGLNKSLLIVYGSGTKDSRAQSPSLGNRRCKQKSMDRGKRTMRNFWLRNRRGVQADTVGTEGFGCNVCQEGGGTQFSVTCQEDCVLGWCFTPHGWERMFFAR